MALRIAWCHSGRPCGSDEAAVVRIAFGSCARIDADPEQLTQAVLNIVRNAAQAPVGPTAGPPIPPVPHRAAGATSPVATLRTACPGVGGDSLGRRRWGSRPLAAGV